MPAQPNDNSTTVTYQLYISREAKALLDSHRIRPYTKWPKLVEPPRVPRSDIQPLFHVNYWDNRSATLKREQQWTLNPRPVPVSTRLNNYHITAVLTLALDHNIVPKRFYGASDQLVTITDETQLRMALLGQFLDAVLLGHLVSFNPRQHRDQQQRAVARQVRNHE